MNQTVDATRRFVIAHGAVRGEYVRLEESWKSLLARRSYAPSVASCLGECLAAAALFTSTLKMLQEDGRLALQIQGGKPVSLLVAECRADLSVRAMARVGGEEALPEGASLQTLASEATFAITIDPGGDYDTYQSLVPMEGTSLSEALGAYMRRSEQIETRFSLAANGTTAVGILLQKVPAFGGKGTTEDPDLWNRVDTLLASLTRSELLDLGDEEVLFRLFHQEEVSLLPARPVRFACRCSKARVASALRLIGREEVQGLLADRRTIDVACDFCGEQYAFSAEEAWDALNA